MQLARPLASFALVAVLVPVVASCGSEVPEPSEPVSASDRSAPTTVTGGSAAQRATLDAFLAGVEQGALESVRIGTSADGFDLDGGWLFVEVPDVESGLYLRNYWRALLVAGAYLDAAKSEDYPALRGLSISVGGAEPTAAVIEGPNPSPSVRGAAEIEERVRAAAVIMNADVASFTLERTDVPAPVVVLRTNDPARFLEEHPSPASELFGDLTDYAGTYLELVSENELVMVQAFVGRVGQGAEWIDPDLAKEPFNFSDAPDGDTANRSANGDGAFNFSDAPADARAERSEVYPSDDFNASDDPSLRSGSDRSGKDR